MSKKIEKPLADTLAWVEAGAEPRQAAFLAALVIAGGNKVAASEAAGISRSAHYKWLDNDERYAALFERATKQAGEELIDEATRRAKDGVREPIFWQGVQCGEKLVYSDSLMQFLLRGAFPERYRERHQHDHKGNLDLKFAGSFADLLATFRKITEDAPQA